MENRKKLLEQLVRLDQPPKKLSYELKSFTEESEKILVELQYEDIIAVLEKYLRGELTATDIHDWADVLELRDDIQFGNEDSHVFSVIFKLASPELEGPLTPPKARALVSALSSESPSEEDIDWAYE